MSVDESRGSSRRTLRLRLVPRSLTNRLVVGAIVLVVVLVAGVGSVTYLVLDHFLYSQLDQQLAADADSDHAGFYFSPRFSYRGARPVGDGAVYAVAFDAQGSTVAPNPALAASMGLDRSDRLRLAADSGGGPTSITTVRGEHLRVQVVQVGVIEMASGVRAPATVAVGLPETDVERTLRRLVTAELIIGAGAIIAAFLATAFGVRKSMRGLNDVTRLAWEVSQDVTPEGHGLTRRVSTQNMDASTEVEQLSTSVNTLLTAVESQVAERARSEQRMRQFLLDASHELRTPLTSIRGFAELTRMHRRLGDAGATAWEQIGDNLDRIESEGVRMSRLVDDLLSLARSDEQVGLNIQLLEIDELVHDGVTSARAAFPDRTIDVDAAPGLVVAGDLDQLRRVLTNLLTNAAVHTRPGGPIRVTATRRGDGGIQLQVIDSGPGLSPEDAAHVFDRFWRADKSRTRASGGSGLGMSIVAAIVANHHGTIEFHSAVDTGSTVTITLPPPAPPSL